jgi:hypothetical protein
MKMNMTSFSFISVCILICIWNVRSFQRRPIISRKPPTRLGWGKLQRWQTLNFNPNRNTPFPFPLSNYSQHQVLQATLSPLSSDSTSINQDNTTKSTSKKFLKLWMHLLSVFLVISFLQPVQIPENLAFFHALLDPISLALRSFLAFLPADVWSLIHAVSGMVFGGSILCTALVEWMWPIEQQQILKDRINQKDNSNNIDDLSLQLLLNKMATKTLFPMEGRLVLPGVSGSMISGVAQAFHNYGSLRLSPRHVKSSLHLMFLFGLWWVLTDRKSQDDIIRLSSMNGELTQKEVLKIWKQRRVFNVISCLLVLALYSIMVLKPGFGS